MSNLTRVVLWMTGTLLSFSAMAVSIRILASRLNIFEILSIRSGAGLLIMLALLAARTDLRPLVRPSRMPLNVLRNVIHFGAQYCWAMALTLLPFATVFALEFITPAWTALLAVWLLSERLTPSRIGAVILGLIGVVIILRPGLCGLQSGGAIGAIGDRWLRHCFYYDQNVDCNGNVLCYYFLDVRDPVSAWPRRQRSAVSV